jgi:hypothetical protein
MRSLLQFSCFRWALALLILQAPLFAVAFGEEHFLSEQEIKTALSGREIKGIWLGNEYTQVFNKDGSTVYRPEDQPVMSGSWYTKNGMQCSKYEGYGEICYQVVREDGHLYWIPFSGERWEFTVVK